MQRFTVAISLAGLMALAAVSQADAQLFARRSGCSGFQAQQAPGCQGQRAAPSSYGTIPQAKPSLPPAVPKEVKPVLKAERIQTSSVSVTYVSVQAQPNQRQPRLGHRHHSGRGASRSASSCR